MIDEDMIMDMDINQIRKWEAVQRQRLGRIREGEVEVQCRCCGKIEHVVIGGNTHFEKRCYVCRKSIYVRDEMIKLFGPFRVPEVDFDENGEMIVNSPTSRAVAGLCEEILSD